jgi:serine/threonine protein kinase
MGLPLSIKTKRFPKSGVGATAKSPLRYFYAMEFVEGETLEKPIRRSGRLAVKLALEIAMQVAGGLAAVHKQKLVHRDIKPSNIMVSVEEEGAVIAKIIDLGLAKANDQPGNQTAISMSGAFVGTPDFASPEQFAGVQVDIRSEGHKGKHCLIVLCFSAIGPQFFCDCRS